MWILHKELCSYFKWWKCGIARNEINNSLRQLTHLLNRTINTTIIIFDVPHCFDLVYLSHVNIENVYNKKLQKTVKTSNYVQIQNMSRERVCCTKCGMHMNSLRKNWMCQEITKRILDLLL
jgi:hypothetical protein